MGIHLFCYTHGGERATSHDVVQDVFASIVKMYGLLHGNNPFIFLSQVLNKISMNQHDKYNPWWKITLHMSFKVGMCF
jgi:hypothetical protein